MARDVEADVQINDKSSRGLASFLAGLRRADDGVKSTQKGIDGAAKSTEKLGKTVDENARAFQRLSSELEVSKKELGELARAFANAGTAAERGDITKAMRKQQTEIRSLTKNRDILKDLLPTEQEVGKEVKKLAPSFGKQLSGLFSDAGELAGPALGIGLAASAPAIAASISGAVIGSAGVGGIVGGIALAAHDPRVQGAWAGFTQGLQSRLTAAAQPFVPVALDGIREIEHALDDINFEGALGDAAKDAGPLIHGVAEAVEALGHGVTDLIHNAGPAVQAIGEGIGDLGRTIGEGLSGLSHNGKAGADALANLFAIVNFGVQEIFGLINGLTTVYGWLRKITGGGVVDGLRAVGDLQRPISGTVDAVARAAANTQLATGVTDQYGQAILTTGDAIETFTSRVDALASAGRSLFDSTTQVGEAIDNFEKALKQNGKTLDANTEKGRNNRAALSSLAAALVANYDAYVQVNGEGTKSNDIAASNRAQFLKLASQMGITGTKAQDLANQLGLIPAKKQTDFYANTHDAAARISALQDKINAVKDKSITVTAYVNASRLNKVENQLARLGGGFDAMQQFAAAGPGDGTQRTGGPNPVSVTSDVTSYLYLDGSLVYTNTARQVRASSRRDAWRQRVGKR